MWSSGPHPDPLPSDGRGDSDWMILFFCECVVRDTVSGGSDIGGSRMRPSIKELEVAVGLEGDFDDSFIKADNRLGVATDAMKNT